MPPVMVMLGVMMEVGSSVKVISPCGGLLAIAAKAYGAYVYAVVYIQLLYIGTSRTY